MALLPPQPNVTPTNYHIAKASTLHAISRLLAHIADDDLDAAKIVAAALPCRIQNLECILDTDGLVQPWIGES
jgi:hypothetical protein